jgi:hypothetical protein
MRTTGAGSRLWRARLPVRRAAAFRLAAAGLMLAVTLVGLPPTPALASPAQIFVPGLVPTIQGAIDVASAGDVVVVAPGTYHEHIDFKGKAIEVRSSGGPSSTTIDGDTTSHVVRFHSGEGRTSILRGFTITHGIASVTIVGGGVSIENASPTIVGNVVTGNDAGAHAGGGIGVAAGSPLIKDNEITGNYTSGIGGAGGGIFAVGSAEIVHNTIRGNSAGGGGGALLAGPVLFTDNRVEDNHASANGGGGLSLGSGHPRVVQNVIEGNSASVRGGGVAWSGTGTADLPEIANNTMIENSAPSGSAIAGADGGAVVVNNVVVGVSAASTVECLGTSMQLATFSHNNVYRGGAAPYAGCPDPTGTNGNISADPRFDDTCCTIATANLLFDLRQDSPSVDTGDNAVVVAATDFAGYARVTDGDGDGALEIDMGAYEADGFARKLPQMPYSVWTQPSLTPLDGLGGWIFPMSPHFAIRGSIPWSYAYNQYFGFVAGGAVGQVGLFSDSTGSFAVFSVVEADGTEHNLSVPFQWRHQRFYFPFVTNLGPGSWGAWVYDDAAATWTSIGTLALPADWGKLAPASVTGAPWIGATAGSCARYPQADVLFYPPFGFVGGVGSVASLTVTAAGAGDCPPATSTAGPWQRYQMGVVRFT